MEHGGQPLVHDVQTVHIVHPGTIGKPVEGSTGFRLENGEKSPIEKVLALT